MQVTRPRLAGTGISCRVRQNEPHSNQTHRRSFEHLKRKQDAHSLVDSPALLRAECRAFLVLVRHVDKRNFRYCLVVDEFERLEI
jgi:hypothetical protein